MVGRQLMVDALGSSVMVGLHQELVCNWLVDTIVWFKLMVGLH